MIGCVIEDPKATAPKLAYNLKEAASATGYSVSTLRLAIRRHDLIARYANSRPIILAEELMEWLRSLPTEPKGGHRPLSIYASKGDHWWEEPEDDPFR